MIVDEISYVWPGVVVRRMIETIEDVPCWQRDSHDFCLTLGQWQHNPRGEPLCERCWLKFGHLMAQSDCYCLEAQ